MPVPSQVIAALAITLLLGAAIVFRGAASPAHAQDGIQDTLETLGGALGGMDSGVPQADRSAYSAGLHSAGFIGGRALPPDALLCTVVFACLLMW